MGKYMNLQVLHQVLTAIGAVSAGLTALLLYAGCTYVLTRWDCSASTIDPTWAPLLAVVATVSMMLKPLVTLVQTGPRGLVRPVQVTPSRGESGKFVAKEVK
jgi:steroid 5-alpha reductase family enzyme